MKISSPLFISLPLTMTIATILSSCTLNEGDPQTTLCKKLTAHLMDEQNVQWGESTKTTTTNNAAKVSLNWNSQDANGSTPMTANCIYLADNNADDEDYDMNVVDGYYNVPESIIINGTETDPMSLAIAIHKVTGQSIKDTVSEEHLRKKAAEANQAVREGAAELQTKAGEAAIAIKEGSETLKQKAGEAMQTIQEESKELKHKAGEVMERTGEYLQKE